MAFNGLGEKSGPLVEAVTSYVNGAGTPPDSLELLVPKYLPMVPETGMGAYPHYEILKPRREDEFHGNNWVLIVRCDKNPFAYDSFIYHPNGNYPKHYMRFSGRVERLGDWAYVHE